MFAEASDAATGSKGKLVGKVGAGLLSLAVLTTPFIWRETSSGHDACMSQRWGSAIQLLCRDEWKRIEISEAQTFTEQLLADIESDRSESEVWDRHFRLDDDQSSADERAKFEDKWTSTLHIEQVKAVARTSSDGNKFAVKIRRYVHSTSEQPEPFFAGKESYAIEDSLTFKLRKKDGEIVGLRPDVDLVSNLGGSPQPQYISLKDTSFMRSPTHGSAAVQKIDEGKMVWLICQQDPQYPDSPVTWARTYIGWVYLPDFAQVNEGYSDSGRQIWPCITDN